MSPPISTALPGVLVQTQPLGPGLWGGGCGVGCGWRGEAIRERTRNMRSGLSTFFSLRQSHHFSLSSSTENTGDDSLYALKEEEDFCLLRFF